MKKKFLAIALGVCAVASLIGCGKDEETTATKGEIKLGEYKGYEVTESDVKITEESLKKSIDSILTSYATTEKKEEGTLAENDKAYLIYEAKIDGEVVSALSKTTETAVTLSETGFVIEGFVDKLIGKTIGETVEFDLVIQDDYTDTTYAGKSVHYAVQIKYVSITVTPELTDEFVVEYYGYKGYKTVDDFKKYIEHEMYMNQVYTVIWDEIIEAQTVVTYDSKDLSETIDYLKSQNEYQLSVYGYDLTSYLSAVDMTEDEYNKKMEEQAKIALKSEMFLEKVVEVEGITISDEEFEEKFNDFARAYGYSKTEEFSSAYAEAYPEATKDELVDMFKNSKVQEMILESVVVVPDETSSETPTSNE